VSYGEKMKKYYVSYQYQHGNTNGFGCITLDYQEFKSPSEIIELANQIASILKMPKNSAFSFFKEF
jgi:hypothetical protein